MTDTPAVTRPLPRSTPEEQGVSSAAVEALVRELDALDSVHGMMLLRHGTVVAEGAWSPYTPERPHALYSVSKSFASAAVGLAMAEGLFDIDDLVVELLPDDLPEHPDPRLARLTVRHLLTMTSGHGGRSFTPRNGVTVASALATPFADDPGSRFDYDTGDTFLAGAIVQRLTGGSLLDYLGPRLFDPLGIRPGWWERSADGLSRGGTGLGLTVDGIARFGQLLLQRGVWEGERLLPEEWVDAATSLQVPTGGPGESADWSQGYGWCFWRCTHDAYRADGAFGQFVVVMPEHDAVLALTAGLDDSQSVLDAVWRTLLPGLGGERAADGLAASALRARLGALRMPPQHGSRTSPAAPHLDRRRYALTESLPGVTALTVQPLPAGSWRILVEARGESEELLLGAGEWQTVHSELLFGAPADIGASAAWVGDEFRIRLVFLLTPFTVTAVLRADGERIEISWTQNVGFEGEKVDTVLRGVRAG